MCIVYVSNKIHMIRLRAVHFKNDYSIDKPSAASQSEPPGKIVRWPEQGKGQ